MVSQGITLNVVNIQALKSKSIDGHFEIFKMFMTLYYFWVFETNPKKEVPS